MNKVVKTLQNKLKNIEQDIKSLQAIDSCENDVCDALDFQEKQEEELEEILLIVESFKRDMESDRTIKEVLQSIELFKEAIEENESYQTDKVFLDYIPNK